MSDYDQWKLATPPEYDELGPDPDEDDLGTDDPVPLNRKVGTSHTGARLQFCANCQQYLIRKPYHSSKYSGRPWIQSVSNEREMERQLEALEDRDRLNEDDPHPPECAWESPY